MKFTVMTLFPEQVRGCIDTSITGRALQKGVFSLETIQIRDFCGNAYGKVDDAMFGGGTGMLMQCDPVYLAWKSIVSANEMVTTHTVYLSPKGSVFTQKKAMDLSQKEHVILLCGHYEGIDQRVIDEIVDEEISIGELAKELIRQINPNARIICDEQRLRPEKSEVNRLLGSNEKIKKLTNWKPNYTFEQGIAETVEFFKGNLDKYKTDIYNI